jgi:hypothetical protein
MSVKPTPDNTSSTVHRLKPFGKIVQNFIRFDCGAWNNDLEVVNDK